MRKAILAGLLLLGGPVAMAADNGIYLGASVGRSAVDFDGALAPIDGDDTGYKLIAGIRPLDWFGVELNYVNFGEVESGPLRAETDGISAYGVFFMPTGPVDLYAKAGLITWDGRARISNGARVFSDDGTDFAYGVGVQFRLLSLSVRAEYEGFDLGFADKANMVSIGATYTFF